jgi:hypothetical protein
LCYMPYPSHSPGLDHSNYTWRKVQVMKLLQMDIKEIVCEGGKRFMWVR